MTGFRMASCLLSQGLHPDPADLQPQPDQRGRWTPRRRRPPNNGEMELFPTALGVDARPPDRWMDGRKALIRRALQDIEPSSGNLILDVAAGDGALSRLVQRQLGGRLVTGDINRAECLRAVANADQVVHASALHLPFADHVADVTVAFEIIEHFEPWQAPALVGELGRVTKPGGLLLLSTPNRYSLESFKGLAKYLITGEVWNARDQTHVTIYSRRSLEAALRPQFSVERSLGYFLVPEVAHRATPLTYRISTKKPAIALCHKLFVVARLFIEAHICQSSLFKYLSIV